MKKVSVIVPCYNAEKFVNKCVDSLINQDYQNLEIILINDGSLDNTLNILREYEKKYKNVKVLTHKNIGLGATRNKGIKNATGDYITFLDSDDWFKKDYVSTLVSNIEDNDIIVSGFQRYNYKYEYSYSKSPSINAWSKYKYCSIAGKMYLTSFLKKNKIIYNKIKIGEDSCFNTKCYSYTNKVKVIEYAGYCNYENKKSMTNDLKFSYEKSFFNVIKTIVNENNIENLEPKEFNFYVLKMLIMDIILYKNCLSIQELINNYNEYIKWYKKFLKKRGFKFKMYFQKGEELKINLAVNLMIIATKIHLQSLVIRFIKIAKISMI